MNTYKTALFLLIGTVFLSCRKENSEDIDQSEIFTDYRIIYRQDLDKTFARATFNHKVNSGENLKLGDDAVITANGMNMLWHPVFLRYEYEFSGITAVKINFIDNEENEFENLLSFNGIAEYEELTAGNDSLYQDSIQFIPWNNAAALISGEYVDLTFIQNTSLVTLSNDTIGATGIYLDNISMDSLQLGNIEAHFEKWIDFTVSSPKAGGFSKSQMISIPKKVKLIN